MVYTMVLMYMYIDEHSYIVGLNSQVFYYAFLVYRETAKLGVY